MEKTLSWEEFQKVDIRVGTILTAESFEETRNPSYKIVIDFGEFGMRKTSAQVTKLYQPKQLIGMQVLAVVNFPPKQVATMRSECLLLGVVGQAGEVILVQPERQVKNGLRIS